MPENKVLHLTFCNVYFCNIAFPVISFAGKVHLGEISYELKVTLISSKIYKALFILCFKT